MCFRGPALKNVEKAGAHQTCLVPGLTSDLGSSGTSHAAKLHQSWQQVSVIVTES